MVEDYSMNDETWNNCKSKVTAYMDSHELDAGMKSIIDWNITSGDAEPENRKRYWIAITTLFKMLKDSPLKTTVSPLSEKISKYLTVTKTVTSFPEDDIDDVISVTCDITLYCPNPNCEENQKPNGDGVVGIDYDEIKAEGLLFPHTCESCDLDFEMNMKTGAIIDKGDVVNCHCCKKVGWDDDYSSNCSECSGYHCESCAHEAGTWCTECYEENNRRAEYERKYFSESVERVALGYREGERDPYDTRDI